MSRLVQWLLNRRKPEPIPLEYVGVYRGQDADGEPVIDESVPLDVALHPASFAALSSLYVQLVTFLHEHDHSLSMTMPVHTEELHIEVVRLGAAIGKSEREVAGDIEFGVLGGGA